jgi:multidrug resistance protein, MATE family
MYLTKYRPGSLREIWSFAFPLMFSCLPSYLMWFIDRCYLTHYSLDALNATVNASTLAWAFIGGASIKAGMTELFVAQYNGAGHQKNIGESVWQMIWFSLATSLVFIPLGIWGSTLFYGKATMEASYFRWTLCFGALQPLSYGLTTFFVGRGRIKWIAFLALFSILLHLLLDFLLIFGMKNWFPALGVTGSAMASCLSLSLQSLILLAFFLRKHNRETFATGNWKFDLKTFWKSSRITAPPAILYNIEQLGWSVFYSIMTSASHTHITISSLCQSLILLFSFFGDGLARGSSVLANNFAGAGEGRRFFSVLKGSCLVLLFFFGLQMLILSLKPNLFVSSFLSTAQEVQFLGKSLGICVWLVLIFLMFQGFQSVLASLLYAKGETLFVLLIGSCSFWLCLILPSYYLIIKKGFSVEWAWGFVVFYSICCVLLYLKRFKQEREPKFICKLSEKN